MGTTRVNYSVVKLIAVVLCVLIIGLNLMMISTSDSDHDSENRHLHLQRNDEDVGAAENPEIVNTTNKLLVTDVVSLIFHVYRQGIGKLHKK